MYYTVIKHQGHLRTRRKRIKHAGECFLLLSSVLKCPECLSQCNARLRHLHLLYDIDFTRAFLYSDKAWVFDQSERAQGAIYIIKHDGKDIT